MRRQNYTLYINGRAFEIQAERLPTGLFADVEVMPRTTKGKGVTPGPNYDGTYNSIQAAMEYESVRSDLRWRTNRYLLSHNGVWIAGKELTAQFGSEGLRRLRELRHDYGWPIEARSRGRGQWDYRMNIDPWPRKRRVIRRAP